MTLDLLLNILDPYFADFPDSPQLLKNALHGSQMLKERPSFYWKLGRENATLFAYALYNILSRDSRYQSKAEEVIKGLEKAYSTLEEETITRNLAWGIIFDEKQKIRSSTPGFQMATVEQKQRLYLVEQADHGYLRRTAEKFYQAFKNGLGGKPQTVEENFSA